MAAEFARAAHDAARLLSWEWDPSADRLTATYGAASVQRAFAAEGASLGDALTGVPSPFREAVAGALASVTANGAEVVVQYPVERGETRAWLETRAHAVEGGEIVRGTTQDVTELWRMRAEVEAAQLFWQATVESLPGQVAVLDQAGRFLAVNDAWARSELGGGSTERKAGDFFALCNAAAGSVSGAAEAAAGVRAILRGDRDELVLDLSVLEGREQRWFRLRATPFRGPGPGRVLVQREDTTAMRRDREALRFQAHLLDAVHVAVVATDVEGLVTHWNEAAERLYGWTREETSGRPIEQFVDGADTSAIRAAVKAGETWEGEFEARRSDGSTSPVSVRAVMVRDLQGRPTGIVGISVDASARLEADRRLHHAEDFLRAVTDSMGDGMLTIDADQRVTHANAAAEAMLGWSADELQGRPMHQTIHYLRPDGSPYPAEDCPVARADDPAEPVRVDDDAFVRKDGTLIAVAYTSSPFLTREGQRGRVVVFRDTSAQKAQDELVRHKLDSLSWYRTLSDALSDDRLRLAAQPIIDLRTRQTVQHELLIRLLDSEGATVAPGEFLPAAEESGIIREIDRWVVGQAVAHAAAGHAVDLNLSAASLGDPGLLAFVERAIAEAGAVPQLLVFELTETALIENEAVAQAFIRGITALGCAVALDDFGTGYGSFMYLKRLPVDYLKIDREFVRDLATNAASRHVVEAVVRLARGFGHKTIAEGVESRRLLDLLVELGVDFAQGYALGRPRPVERVLLPMPIAGRERSGDASWCGRPDSGSSPPCAPLHR